MWSKKEADLHRGQHGINVLLKGHCSSKDREPPVFPYPPLLFDVMPCFPLNLFALFVSLSSRPLSVVVRGRHICCCCFLMPLCSCVYPFFPSFNPSYARCSLLVPEWALLGMLTAPSSPVCCWSVSLSATACSVLNVWKLTPQFSVRA